MHQKTASGATLDITYPEIAGAPVANAAIKRILDPLRAEFQSVSSMPAGPSHVAGSISGNYSATQLQTGILSVLIEWSEYAPGAAHPGGFVATVNYDDRTRRVLVLGDLFRPGAPYRKRLSQLCAESLASQGLIESSGIRESARTIEAKLKDFTVTEKALVLHFSMAEVAATAAGTPQVAVPLEKLAGMLRKR